MNELETFRREIDAIDQAIRELFRKRMDIVDKVAEYKMAHDMIVYDPVREEELIKSNVEGFPVEEYREYYREVLNVILHVSKEHQKSLIMRSTL